MANQAGCPACSNVRGNKAHATVTGVYHCGKCDAIFGQCYLGDSYGLVLPYWAVGEVPAEKQRYFDFTTLGSAGVGRRHGWYDVETRKITQVG